MRNGLANIKAHVESIYSYLVKKQYRNRHRFKRVWNSGVLKDYWRTRRRLMRCHRKAMRLADLFGAEVGLVRGAEDAGGNDGRGGPK